MKIPRLLAGSLAGLALFAAGSAVSGPRATPPPEPVAAAGSYRVDPVHSGVLFRIEHLGVGAFWGRFNRVEGSFELKKKVADSSVEITIAADSVDTNSADRDKHVKGPDFFSVVEFPEITFRSTKVVQVEDVYRVTGDMTLRGKTNRVTLELAKVGEADTRMGARAGFEGEFTFDRTDFGASGVQGALGNEIRVIVFIEGVKG